MCKPAAATKATARASQQKKPATKNFEGCGVDRSCPTSVTSHSCQNVRLDQYQSPTTGIRRRNGSSGSNTTGGLDHEFVWYDLDAIREKSGRSTCDGIAGLLFTTRGQVLNGEAEANTTSTARDNRRSSSSSSSSSLSFGAATTATAAATATSSRQLLEFDAFVWPTFSFHNSIEESTDDREFREQIEELEDELCCGDEFASESTMSSFYW
jgi:hypothetical protein